MVQNVKKFFWFNSKNYMFINIIALLFSFEILNTQNVTEYLNRLFERFTNVMCCVKQI